MNGCPLWVFSIDRAIRQLQALVGERSLIEDFDFAMLGQISKQGLFELLVNGPRLGRQLHFDLGYDRFLEIIIILGIYRDADILDRFVDLGIREGHRLHAVAIPRSSEPTLLKRAVGASKSRAVVEIPRLAP